MKIDVVCHDTDNNPVLIDVTTASSMKREYERLKLSLAAALFEQWHGVKPAVCYVAWFPRNNDIIPRLDMVDMVDYDTIVALLAAYAEKEDPDLWKEEIATKLPSDIVENLHDYAATERAIIRMRKDNENIKEIVKSHFVQYGKRNYKDEQVEVLRRAATIRRQVDTVLLREKYPDIHMECIKPVEVKETFIINAL